MKPSTPLPLKVISGLGPPASASQPSPAISLEPEVYRQATKCVQCGLCLPTCPTYLETGKEAQGPRGRIHLMKSLSDGQIALSASVLRDLDQCLDCRACETACPSGVSYHQLIEQTREQLFERPQSRKLSRALLLLLRHVLPYPRRLQAMMSLGQWAKEVRLESLVAGRMPALGPLLNLLPDSPVHAKPLAAFHPALAAKPSLRVVLHTGCVASVLASELHHQTVELLQHAGCEVHVPRAQGCCGAIAHHLGDTQSAKQLASRNLEALLRLPDGGEPDVIVSNVAGCGAMLKSYGHLLPDAPSDKAKAKTFAAKVRDITQLLAELDGLRFERALPWTVTYHDACHLAHAQRITAEPRVLLGRVSGLKVLPLPESDLCCGSAGSYSLLEPDMARSLGERKLRNITQTGAEVCISANLGCTMHIESNARRLGTPLRVMHPVSVLHAALQPR